MKAHRYNQCGGVHRRSSPNLLHATRQSEAASPMPPYRAAMPLGPKPRNGKLTLHRHLTKYERKQPEIESPPPACGPSAITLKTHDPGTTPAAAVNNGPRRALHRVALPSPSNRLKRAAKSLVRRRSSSKTSCCNRIGRSHEIRNCLSARRARFADSGLVFVQPGLLLTGARCCSPCVPGWLSPARQSGGTSRLRFAGRSLRAASPGDPQGTIGPH